jgi:hypothetical protein
MYFLVTLAENPGRAGYGGQWICGFTHFMSQKLMDSYILVCNFC